MFSGISRPIAILLPLLIAACHWNDPPPADTLVFALSSEPKTLDPRYATDAGGQRIGSLIFSSLIQKDKSLQTQGNLAESWTYKDLTYRFKLKPGIQFHNGEKATREDFLYSIEEFKKSRSPFSTQFKVIESAKAEYNFETGGFLALKLKSFASSFFTDLVSLKLLPKKIASQMGDDFYKNPIGSGPFRFDKMDIKNIHLSKYQSYFGKKPVTDKLLFKVIKDSNTRFQKMYKGQIDIVQSDVPFSKVQFFKSQKNFSVIVEKGLSTTYILINLRHPLLSKKKVRRAISSAIDRNELIEYTHEGYAEPATSIITNANPFHNHDLSYSKMSPDQIKEVFKMFQDQPVVLKTSNTQGAIENGKVISNQLKQMGLPVEQKSYEWGTYYEDVRTGKFDLAIMKWVGISDPDIYRISLHSEMTPPGRNRGFYKNPSLDRLVDQAFREPDVDKRKSLYWEAQKLVFDDLPTIPLWYEKQVAIVHNRVKNYSLPMNGDFSALLEAHKEQDE